MLRHECMKQRIPVKSVVTLLLVLNILLLYNIIETCKADEGNILYVNDDSGENYMSIQEAIDHAQDGDTVFVYNGTYYENLIINKTITLTGENKNTTIIDGSERGDVVSIVSDSVNVTGFTITNGGSDINASAGVKLNSSNSTISGCIITNNGKHGILIMRLNYNNTIRDNIITNNRRDGISASYVDNNVINDNRIINNVCGISLCSSYNNWIIRNTIVNNTENGISMCGSSDRNVIYHNTIDNWQFQAFDLHNNIWYSIDLGEGNYWGDYTGSDADSDGIGDTPYHIYGGENQDKYPLMTPPEGNYLVPIPDGNQTSSEGNVSDNNEDKMLQTPGFEIVLVVIAIALVLFLKRKTK